SILASGDGKTPKTAYKVISIPEEYMTLWRLGLVVEEQSLVESDGRQYDAMRVKHRKTGEESVIYFDIQVFAKLANQPTQRNAGSRPPSDDSPEPETPSSLGPRG